MSGIGPKPGPDDEHDVEGVYASATFNLAMETLIKLPKRDPGKLRDIIAILRRLPDGTVGRMPEMLQELLDAAEAGDPAADVEDIELIWQLPPKPEE